MPVFSKHSHLAAVAVSVMGACPALADVPQVVTDIAPVHGLVSRVMAGVGTPDLLLNGGESPHNYSLRPSDAGAVQDADLIVWTDPGLTPWLGDTLGRIAPDTPQLVLGELPETSVLEFRTGAMFEPHSHDHGEAEGHDDHDHDDNAARDHDEHDHDEHAEHDHDEHAHDDHDSDGHDDHDHEGHDDHAHDDHGDHDEDAHDEDHDDHDHDAHAGHDHGDYDPHMWLDPDNAIVWLDAIADTLAELDPENAEAYHANAEAGRAEIAEVEQELQAKLDALDDLRFVVFHDAYHYFEAHFGIEAVGAISLSDATAPSPRRLAEVREGIEAANVNCAFSEPQFSDKLVDTVIDGLDIKKGQIDPLGAHLEVGPEFYPALLESFGSAFEGCQ